MYCYSNLLSYNVLEWSLLHPLMQKSLYCENIACVDVMALNYGGLYNFRIHHTTHAGARFRYVMVSDTVMNSRLYF